MEILGYTETLAFIFHIIWKVQNITVIWNLKKWMWTLFLTFDTYVIFTRLTHANDHNTKNVSTTYIPTLSPNAIDASYILHVNISWDNRKHSRELESTRHFIKNSKRKSMRLKFKFCLRYIHALHQWPLSKRWFSRTFFRSWNWNSKMSKISLLE